MTTKKKPAKKKPGRKPSKKATRPGNLRARFVEEFLIDRNGTQAAIRAGYSPGSAAVTACRLLKEPNILQDINQRTALVTTSRGITAERVMEEYYNLAFLDPLDLFEADGTMKRLEDMPENARRAIGGIEIRELTPLETPNGPIRVQIKKIKLVDKKGSLDSLAKIMGMMREKLDVTVKATAEEMEAAVDAELADLA